jgi:hypothetical protein
MTRRRRRIALRRRDQRAVPTAPAIAPPRPDWDQTPEAWRAVWAAELAARGEDRP